MSSGRLCAYNLPIRRVCQPFFWRLALWNLSPTAKIPDLAAKQIGDGAALAIDGNFYSRYAGAIVSGKISNELAL